MSEMFLFSNPLVKYCTLSGGGTSRGPMRVIPALATGGARSAGGVAMRDWCEFKIQILQAESENIASRLAIFTFFRAIFSPAAGEKSLPAGDFSPAGNRKSPGIFSLLEESTVV
jgi:hypothetical protein